MSETRAKILAFIRQAILDRSPSSVDPSTIQESTLILSCVKDSLEQLELVMRIEAEYGIGIPDDIMVRFVTIDDVLNYGESLLDIKFEWRGNEYKG